MTKTSFLAYIKNVLLVLLTITCIVLVVRLWFGSFSMHDLLLVTPVSSPSDINPWDEAAAPLVIRSASVGVTVGGVECCLIFNNLVSRDEWLVSYSAIQRLIEEGVFVGSGSIGFEAFGYLLSDYIVIRYNSPMPSGFFREYFGSRPGFLSSHFDNFDTIIIAPASDDLLEVTFFRGDDFFSFELSSEFDFNEVVALLNNSAENENVAQIRPNVVDYNPIEDFSSESAAVHMSFFFPNQGQVTPNFVNNILTYYDNRRVGRLFPGNIAEFTAIPNNRGIDDYTRALLTAFDMINNDAMVQQAANENTPKNEVILVGYEHNPVDGRHYFFFDYILGDEVLDLGEMGFLAQGMRHALEINVIGREVVFYRRVMMRFDFERESEINGGDYEY